MTDADVLDIARQAILVALLMGGPVMLAGLLAGVIISLLQSITQINEMTLTFVPKILIIFISLLVFLPFMLDTISDFTRELIDRIVGLG
ncbi:MAG: flagellar biosynthesis protein FliQ [Proteobacteria bacterium]|nr:flagellar biosynthesis protein FliQ [Pseudomonadota bacterium]